MDRLILSLANAWACLRHPMLVWREVGRCGRLPNIAAPVTANEKFLWRRIFDHDPRIAMTCDKLATKAFVAERCPGLKIARVLWTGDDPKVIPEGLLRGDVVVKASHGCAWNYFVNGGQYDRAELERLAARWMRKTYGRKNFEWGYFGVPHRLFIEEMITGPGGLVHTEVKLMMYGGRCLLVVVINDRFGIGSASVYDGELNWMDVASGIGLPVAVAPPPKGIDEIMRAAKLLSRDFDHMRCDFYDRDGEVWFAELTAYNLAGRMDYKGCDRNSEFVLGWDLRLSWFLNAPQGGWRRRYAQALRRRLDERHVVACGTVAPPAP